jgi:hypothetical protein
MLAQSSWSEWRFVHDSFLTVEPLLHGTAMERGQGTLAATANAAVLDIVQHFLRAPYETFSE